MTLCSFISSLGELLSGLKYKSNTINSNWKATSIKFEACTFLCFIDINLVLLILPEKELHIESFFNIRSSEIVACKNLIISFVGGMRR